MTSSLFKFSNPVWVWSFFGKIRGSLCILDPASTYSSTKSNRWSNSGRCSYFVPWCVRRGRDRRKVENLSRWASITVASFALPLPKSLSIIAKICSTSGCFRRNSKENWAFHNACQSSQEQTFKSPTFIQGPKRDLATAFQSKDQNIKISMHLTFQDLRCQADGRASKSSKMTRNQKHWWQV